MVTLNYFICQFLDCLHLKKEFLCHQFYILLGNCPNDPFGGRHPYPAGLNTKALWQAVHCNP